MAVSTATEGLTGQRMAQSTGTNHAQADGSVRLLVGSLWAESKMGLC